MKKSLILASCLAALIMPLATAHAYDSAPRDRQYMSSGREGADVYAQPNPNYNQIGYYNHDAAARNRGESNTGANMGPGGRNSGFDDNEALHGSSSRHINDTAIDGSDTYRSGTW